MEVMTTVTKTKTLVSGHLFPDNYGPFNVEAIVTNDLEVEFMHVQ